MSSRPDPSVLIMNPLFTDAAGPFDPKLSHERALQVAALLTSHKLPPSSTPVVLGQQLAETCKKIPKP